MSLHKSALALAHWPLLFSFIPFPPRQRNSSVVTAPVVGGTAFSHCLLVVAHRYRSEDPTTAHRQGPVT